MRSVIIATENTGKFEEIKALLSDEFDTFYSLRSFEEKVVVEENSPLYIENAMKKARKIGDRFGMHTIADDSGLEVEILGRRPGVYSSRYGKTNKERIERLLSEMEGVPQEKRGAVFKAYLAFYMPEKERNYVFYGQLAGYIGFEKKGMSGFGFDPIFFIPHLRKSLAELTMDEKNRMSHRGKAVWALKIFLNADFFKSPRVLSL
jgi:XTP/dITP diphosphohydrolase